MTVRFFFDDFTVGSDQSLASYGGYVDNSDRNDWGLIAADDAAQVTLNQPRFAGPTDAPGTVNQEGRIRGTLGGTNSEHRIGALCRWNGLSYDNANVRAYRVMVRGGDQYVVSRHYDTNVTWLSRGGNVVHDLPQSVAAGEEFGLALLVTDSGTDVELQAYIDTGAGWEALGAAFVDSSTEQITAAGHVGMFAQRSVSRITSLEGRDEGVGVLTEDPFDNIAAGNTQPLENRTDPVSWAGNLTNWTVVGDLNKLQRDSNTNNVASIDVEPLGQGYIGELLGVEFPDNLGGDHVGLTVRSNKGDWGTTITCYELQVRVSDEWYLYRRVDGGFEIIDSDINAPFGITWESIIGIQVKTAENESGNVVIDAWVSIDGGSFSQIITGLIDDSTTVGEERILDTGTVGIHGNRSGQLFGEIRAYQEEPTELTVSSVTPSTIRDADSFTIGGTFPNTVTSVTIDGDSQTISSQDGTSVTCAFALADIKYGTHTITVDDGTTTDTIPCFVDSASGIEWTDTDRLPWPSEQLSTFDGSTDTEFGTARDVQDGMQVEWVVPTDLGADNDVYFDGVPEVFSDSGSHVFDVRVHDNIVRGPWATYTITSDLPSPPVADAGPDQTVNLNDTVTVDAGGSTFPGGQAEDGGYSWTRVSGPTITDLEGNDLQIAEFTASETGTYILQVEVRDAYGQTDTDQVTIESVDPFTVALTTGTAHGVGVALNFGGSFVVGLTVGTAHGVGQTLDISTGAVNAVTVGTAHGVGQTLGVEAGTGVVLALSPGTAHGVGQALELEDSAVLALQAGTAHGTGQTLAARAGLSLALTAGTAHGTGVQLDFGGGLVAAVADGQAHGTGQTLAAATGQNLALQSGQAHGVGVALGTVLGDSVSFTVSLTPGLAHGNGAALAANAGLSLALGNGVANGTGQVLDVALANALALEVGAAHGSGQALGLVTGDSVPFSVALQVGTAHGVGPQLAAQVGIVAALQPGTAHGTGAALSLVTSDSVEYVEALVAGQAHGVGQQLQFTGGSRTAWLHGTAQGVGIELGSNLNHRFMVLTGQASGTGVDLATTTGNRIELGMGTAHGVGVDLDTFTGFILGHIANPSTRNISTTYSTREIQ